jgi:hypothetical protein
MCSWILSYLIFCEILRQKSVKISLFETIAVYGTLFVIRGAEATGAAGANASVAETVRGRHGGGTGATGCPFSSELRFEICAVFT